MPWFRSRGSILPCRCTLNMWELVHCIMLVNLLCLLSAIKATTVSHQIATRPTQVALPLSPNHGLFGNNGLCCASSACHGMHPSFCMLCHHLGEGKRGSRGVGAAHALMLGARERADHTWICRRGWGQGSSEEKPHALAFGVTVRA
jgi:hypothetical protein